MPSSIRTRPSKSQGYASATPQVSGGADAPGARRTGGVSDGGGIHAGATIVERSAADGCRGCPLYEDATQTVFGEGREDADRPRLPGVAITRFGRIDTWVNNAALFLQGRVEDTEPAEYRRMVEVNLLGVIFGTRCAILRMRGGGGGVIVQLSSIVGRWRPRVQASLLRSAEQGVFLLPLIAG